MAPAAHSSSAIFVELGLALWGGSRGLEGRTLTVRMGREPSTHCSRKCFGSSVVVEVKFFHGGLGSGHQSNFICSHFRTRSPT